MRLPNKKEVKSSKIGKWIIDFCNKSVVAKTIATIVIWAIVSIPFDFYLLIRMWVNPLGFWQELAMLVVWATILGWLQALLIFGGIFLTLIVLFDNV